MDSAVVGGEERSLRRESTDLRPPCFEGAQDLGIYSRHIQAKPLRELEACLGQSDAELFCQTAPEVGISRRNLLLPHLSPLLRDRARNGFGGTSEQDGDAVVVEETVLPEAVDGALSASSSSSSSVSSSSDEDELLEAGSRVLGSALPSRRRVETWARRVPEQQFKGEFHPWEEVNY